MANLNRFKFTFGKKTLTLTTEHDNLFMEEIAKVATEKYEAIKEQMPGADDETVAILLAVNCLSTQLSREIEFDDKEQELESLRYKVVAPSCSMQAATVYFEFAVSNTGRYGRALTTMIPAVVRASSDADGML